MKIAVFGANGKVGQRIVTQLLSDGHEVRAFTHSNSQLASHPKLETIRGDVRERSDVARAIQGSDAVISALGSWGTKSKDILATGMRSIIPAMEAAGIRRIVSLTGAGARDSVDRPPLLERISRPLLLLVAPKILRDGEQHIALLRASNLDWTVVRSPVMRDHGRRGYQLTDRALAPWATIQRDDVVSAMTALINTVKHSRSAPFIKHL
jgi:putative NADH-flavin reductase